MMKLEKFKLENKKKKSIIIFTVCCVLLIVGVFFYQSFALFETRENFNFIEGQVQDPGDLYFAYYVEDVLTYEMPSKDSGYTLSSKSSCTNGVTISWDDEEWMAKVYYKNYQKENNSRVKCTLYFEEKVIPPSPSDTVKDYIIAKASEGEIIEDDGTTDHNMRYIGANPNNYIDIGDRDADGNVILWRIIGSFNNIKSNLEDEEGATRLKIIRSELIGTYSWDSSDSSVNSGYGVNEWSQADAMKLLNPGYDDEAVGGSLYWNRGNGTCYNANNNTTTTCDFTNNGLSEAAKVFIEDTLWNTGTTSGTDQTTISASSYYNMERSDNYRNCSGSSSYCNDTVSRTATWIGKIGLIYPSDYIYATAGGTTCYSAKLYNWKSNCYNTDWLYKNDFEQWTLTAGTQLSMHYYYDATGIGRDGTGYMIKPYYAAQIFPVIYLKANTLISSGDGTQKSPFIATLD